MERAGLWVTLGQKRIRLLFLSNSVDLKTDAETGRASKKIDTDQGFSRRGLNIGPHANGIQRKQMGMAFFIKDNAVVSFRVKPQEIWTPVLADQHMGMGSSRPHP